MHFIINKQMNIMKTLINMVEVKKEETMKNHLFQ